MHSPYPKRARQRAEATGEGRWHLSDVMPASKDRGFDEVISKLENKTASFEALRQKLPSFGRNDLEDTLSLYEEISEILARVGAYAYLHFSEDTRNQDAKALLDRTEEQRADIDNRVLFFRLWWIGLDEGRTGGMAPSNPDHAYFLSLLRKLRPHTLEEKVEQALNLKNTTGFSSWVHHYDQITSDYTFELKPGVKGSIARNRRPRKLVRDEVSRLFASPDPSLRKAAYQAILVKYAEGGRMLGEVYRTIIRDWKNEYVKLRAYSSPISPRNLENDVPDESVEALLSACRENAVVFQDFFRLKGSLLGNRRIPRYDIYAPLQKRDRRISYSDAVKMVMQAFGEFDQRFARMAMKVFEAQHVDTSPRKGKEPGAYCMSVSPAVVPYLLLNYAGRIADAYTIAHESGHAVHSQLSSNHSVLTFMPPLVLAETASVFGEMLLYDKMMKDERDAEVKKGVLLEKISSMYATIGRQAYFVLFEMDAHKAVADGSTVEKLCALYLSNLTSQFGSAVGVPKAFKWEWTSIPHFYHTPFYCYAYAFGNLLSLALYDRYVREGREFVPAFMKILGYGGSKSPADILQEVGFDVLSRGFWQGGFDVVGRMVRELRRL